MTKKELRRLVESSYKDGKLDKKTIFGIAKNLKKRDLKSFIKAIKILEQKKTLLVYLSEPLKDESLPVELKARFPGKKIKFRVDKKILAGIKIVDYDRVYDFSLESKLNNMIYQIK